MRRLLTCVFIESKKLFCSKVPLITLLSVMLIPFVGGFFMFVLKDPDFAQKMGLISTKVQFVGTADWPSFLSLISQAIAIGGLIVFGFVTSWVFGREYSDRTIKDLLALPTSRCMIVLSKFIVIYLWCLILSVFVFATSLIVGVLIYIPGLSLEVLISGVKLSILCAVLTIFLSSPVALLASIGRGYLSSFGFMIFTIVLAQIIAAVGYGHLFPWSIPAVASGMTGDATIDAAGILVVIVTNVMGVLGTMLWWRNADHG